MLLIAVTHSRHTERLNGRVLAIHECATRSVTAASALTRQAPENGCRMGGTHDDVESADSSHCCKEREREQTERAHMLVHADTVTRR